MTYYILVYLRLIVNIYSIHGTWIFIKDYIISYNIGIILGMDADKKHKKK